jgi:hypothetical protein
MRSTSPEFSANDSDNVHMSCLCIADVGSATRASRYILAVPLCVITKKRTNIPLSPAHFRFANVLL